MSLQVLLFCSNRRRWRTGARRWHGGSEDQEKTVPARRPHCTFVENRTFWPPWRSRARAERRPVLRGLCRRSHDLVAHATAKRARRRSRCWWATSALPPLAGRQRFSWWMPTAHRNWLPTPTSSPGAPTGGRNRQTTANSNAGQLHELDVKILDRRLPESRCPPYPRQCRSGSARLPGCAAHWRPMRGNWCPPV